VSAQRALVLGAAGQLGKACMDCAPKKVAVEGLSRATCDVTDDAALRRVIDEVSPHVVINAAAYTAVDAAEDAPQSADAVNANAPAMLGALCAQRGLRLVHISTDFVFDGRAHRPYTPDADPSPLGVYGASKWRGEQAVLASGAGHAVVRTSWVYGPGGRNFVLTMLRLMREQGTVRVVNDQIGAPTSARGLAEVCWLLALHADASGVFHWSDAGAISWHDFACGIHDEALALGLLSAPATIEAIPTEAFPTKAQRPAYSVLDCSDTCSALNVTQQPWREALRDMLRSQQELEGTV
jgi:dTDP-4-dehydrorhamnose reductase